jgi:hypothetical protein
LLTGTFPTRRPSAPTEFPKGPSALQRRGERASPNVQGMGPKGGGHRRPATPQGGCRPRLAPKSLAATMAIGQQPTDLTSADRETRRASATQAARTRPEGGPTPPWGRSTPRHRPGRSVSRRGTRHRGGHAERKGAENRRKPPLTQPRNGARVTGPGTPPTKGAPLQWSDSQKSPSAKASDAAGPGDHPSENPPAGQGTQIQHRTASRRIGPRGSPKQGSHPAGQGWQIQRHTAPRRVGPGGPPK